MKKIKLLLGVVSLFTSIFALNSCKKSYQCCYAGVCTTVTKPNNMSQSAFKNYIKTIESTGYTCK